MEQARRLGQQVKALEEKPELYEDLSYVWVAFDQLHLARTYGMEGPNPLQVSEIAAWMELRGISDPEERSDLYELLAAMDATWLAWARQTVKDKRANGAKPPANH